MEKKLKDPEILACARLFESEAAMKKHCAKHKQDMVYSLQTNFGRTLYCVFCFPNGLDGVYAVVNTAKKHADNNQW